MRIGHKQLPSIYNVLGFLLIVSIMAFNEEKYLTYPIKIIFILIFGLYWLKTSSGRVNLYQFWCILMCIFSVIAVFVADDSGRAIHTLVNVLQVFLIAFVLSAYLTDQGKIELYLKFFVFGGLILFFRLLIKTPMSVWTSFNRLGETIGYNANDVGNKAAIAAIISICLFKNKEQPYRKIYLIIFVFMNIVVLFSGSRKALLAVIIAVIFIYTVGLENKKNLVFSIIALCIILNISYHFIMTNESLYMTIGRRIESMINVIFHGGSEASSIDLREKYMSMAWSYIKDSPLIGIGLGNFASKSGLGIYCHSDYLEVMCSYGIPVAFFYYFPLIRLVFRSILKKRKDETDYSMITISLVLLMSFVTMVMYISAYTQIIIAIVYAYFNIATDEKKIVQKKSKK